VRVEGSADAPSAGEPEARDFVSATVAIPNGRGEYVPALADELCPPPVWLRAGPDFSARGKPRLRVSPRSLQWPKQSLEWMSFRDWARQRGLPSALRPDAPRNRRSHAHVCELQDNDGGAQSHPPRPTGRRNGSRRSRDDRPWNRPPRAAPPLNTHTVGLGSTQVIWGRTLCAAAGSGVVRTHEGTDGKGRCRLTSLVPRRSKDS
jgi:hypothetical protein